MPLPPGGATLHSLCFSHQIPSNSQQPNTTPLSAKPKTLLQKQPPQPPPPLLNTQIKDKIMCLEIIGLDANKALSQNPTLHHTTPQSLQSTIDFLLSKGLHHKDLPRILDMCPTVLTSDIKSDLTPVFNFLSTDLNLPHHMLRRVINKCPRLLVSSVKAQLRPALAFLNGLGLKDLHALAHKYPVLLVSSVDNTLIPKIDYLEGLVLSRDEAVGMVFRSPALLTYSIDNSFRPKFDYFKVDMEGKVEEVIEFPQYFSFSLEKRIKPRHMEVVKSGVLVPLPLMLKTTHEEFMQLLRQNEQLDPFSLVADERLLVANRLRAMVFTQVPKLASAAGYFFKLGVEGKMICPTVLLLMATALNVSVPKAYDRLGNVLPTEIRVRQQSVAEITEMIHVTSLIHDDVLDDADTRRGIGSLNFVMDNKMAVLTGDFLLSRAFVALAALKNTEVVSLLATAVENLVTGEIMQMTTTSEQCCSLEQYMRKTYYKTASLISNSCKAIAVLAGQTTEVSTLAYEYGKNLGLAYQLIDDVLDFTGTSAALGKGSLSDIRHGILTAPIFFAMEEFPQLHKVVKQGFENQANVEIALEYLGKSHGIQRTRELAMKHAEEAVAAINSLPESYDEDVLRSRGALIELTTRLIKRTK